MLTKGTGLEENMILTRYALNTGAPNLIKQIWLAVKPQINPSKIIELSLILWRFLSIDRSSLLKNRNMNIKWHHRSRRLRICRTFHTNTAEYTSFLAAHETFFKRDHMLGHKANLNKHRKISKLLMSYLITMERIKSKRNPRTHTDSWRLNNTILDNQCVIE